jgi:hypothetical protein
MNDRDRFLSILRGGTPDRVPWGGDLTYWAYAMEKRGQAPAGWQSTPAYYQFHRDLRVGFYLQGYFPFRTVYDDTVRFRVERQGDVRLDIYETPVGTLTAEWTYLPESYAEAPSRHMVQTPADLRTLRYLYEHTHYEPDYAEAGSRYSLVPDLGVVLCYLPKSPLMNLVALDAGISSVVELHMTVPDELAETLAVMERKLDEAAQIALDSPAECLMIPENLSSEVVGKRFYNQYARPYNDKWVQRIRAAGKHSFIHMDGTLKGLIAEVAATGFDVIEAATPAPVGDLNFAEMRSRVGERTILWGGVPGVYFTNLVDDDEFDRLVIDVLTTMRTTPRYVLGVADQVPPDGLRCRVARVAELVDRYGFYGSV